MESYEYLSKGLIKQFGDRKHQGRLSIVIDISSDQVYVIPRDKEHIEFSLDIVQGKTRRLERIIPSNIGYNDVEGLYEINSIITGESGMERGYGIRHKTEDLNEAHQKAMQFVNDGIDDKELFLQDDMESRIIYNFK